jgi:mono/diheme cytochrome c family protein
MWKKFLGYGVLTIVVVLSLGFAYLYFGNPATAPPSSIKIEPSEARLARGKYLFHHVAVCGDCHSQRDFTRFGGPVIEGGDGLGFAFPQEMGFPGTVVAPNITPDKDAGIGNWTDGEVIRASLEGVSRAGSALFPLMPYADFRHMSDEDVYALVAYLRTLPPAKNVLPRSKINFPVSMLINSAPKPAGHVPPVDRNDPVKYGGYLTRLGGCAGCHTPMEKGEPLPGKQLAGGEIFRTPMGTVVSANITPDKDTGLGKWSEQDFLHKFYQYRKYVEEGSPKIGPESFTLMPWLPFCQLPEEDLKAIFTFLKTQPPVYNAVETHPAHLQPLKPVS